MLMTFRLKKKFPEFHCFCKVILIGWVLAICICTFDGNYVCTQHRGLNKISLRTNIVVRNGGSLQEMKCFTSNFVEGSKPF